MTYTPLASDKTVYLYKKPQHIFDIIKVFAKRWKVILSDKAPQVGFRMIQFFGQALVKDSTTV